MKRSPQRGFLVVFAMVAALAWALFVSRRSAPTAAPLQELHLTNLVQRGGIWLVAGTTNTFTGVLLDTYDDGAKKSRSTISNGLPDGPSIGWHTNGQVQIEEQFVSGDSHGLRTKWHPNGRKLSEANVVSGKLQGRFRRWHDNGALADEMQLKDGQPEGVSRAYYPSGFAKSRVTLRAGKVVEETFWKDGEHREPTSPDSAP